MNARLEMDVIEPGKHQEVLRKIHPSLENGYLTPDVFASFGLTAEDNRND
jgi:hypothetical protein